MQRTEDIGKRLGCRVVSLEFQEIPGSVLGSLAGWALGWRMGTGAVSEGEARVCSTVSTGE